MGSLLFCRFSLDLGATHIAGHAQVEQGTQQLAQKRMEFVQELATRQAPVALAAGLKMITSIAMGIAIASE